MNKKLHLVPLALLLFLSGTAHGFASVAAPVSALMISATALITAFPGVSAARDKSRKTEDDGHVAPEQQDLLSSLLVVEDMNELTMDISKNWGFILTGGVIKVLAGVMAFLLPTYASEVAYVALAITAFVTGVSNCAGFIFEESGFRLSSLAVGVAQVFLAYRMYYRPFSSLLILTQMVAGTSLVEGVYQGVVALMNTDIPGWGSLLFSGAVSVMGGILVARTLLKSSLFVLGISFGSHLVSGGWASISVALQGREIANEALG